MSLRHIRLVALIILLLAFALRAYQLESQSLWYDEGLSVYLAALPLNETIVRSAVTDHPPLHAVLLNLWMGQVGSGEFSVRFVSVFFGTLAVALTHSLGRTVGGARVGTLAAGLITLAPMAVWYAQEARGYSLLITLILIAVLALLRLVIGDWRLRVWLTYVLSCTAALYTHYFAIFFIIAMNLAFLTGIALDIVRVRRLRQDVSDTPAVIHDMRYAIRDTPYATRNTQHAIYAWLLAQLAIAVLFLPWLPNALAQAASNATYFPGRVTWDTVVLETWRAFTVGDFSHLGRPAPPSPINVIWLALVFLGLVSPFLRRRLSCTPLPPRSQPTRNLLLIVTLLTIPLLLMSLLAWEKPKFAPRYLLPSLPAFVVLAALGIDALARFRSRWLTAVTPAPLLLILIGDLLVTAQAHFDPSVARPDVRAVAAYIDASDEPGDAILLVGGHQTPVFEYYYDGVAAVVSLPPDLLPAARSPLDARVVSQLADVAARHPRAWLVLWQQDIADPTGIVLGELQSRARRLEVGQNFHAMSLLLFDVSHVAFRVEPQHALDVAFAAPIRMVGFDLDSYQFIPGQDLNFALYFQSDGPIGQNYQVFAHLVDPDGSIAAQADRIAGADSYPTSVWAIGTHVRNTFNMHLPAGLPAGTYRLVAGLYDASGRLALSAGGDAVEIATITIQPYHASPAAVYPR